MTRRHHRFQVVVLLGHVEVLRTTRCCICRWPCMKYGSRSPRRRPVAYGVLERHEERVLRSPKDGYPLLFNRVFLGGCPEDALQHVVLLLEDVSYKANRDVVDPVPHITARDAGKGEDSFSGWRRGCSWRRGGRWPCIVPTMGDREGLH